MATGIASSKCMGACPPRMAAKLARIRSRVMQEYRLEPSDHGLHPIGPERIDDDDLQRRLLTMQQRVPTFILIAGYTFGLFEGRCDDQLALAAF